MSTKCDGPAPRPVRETTPRWSFGRVAGFGAFTIALANAAVHGTMLGTMPFVQSILWAAMTLACIACGVHLVRRASAGAWAMTSLMSLGMVAVHLPGSNQSGHHHGDSRAGGDVVPVSLSFPMQASLILTVAELLLGLIGLWVLTSHGRWQCQSEGQTEYQEEPLSGDRNGTSAGSAKQSRKAL
ncbi:hypothetical protein [Rhodococcus sp. (in: high G+C Gram-positive bacteria)]|uniref:hypothetical protein n=1 Tax=Rhodococcus sp. TaxID=1831 RepID=UPI00257BD096|nr:hypothetical protein [Rhodococcus sp. (in: high G+C Gram-positive bacteria)]MBQ7804438.1 hypothetical protein [Rhodococcus sp. (in: high G+C Gram-positive bacteria)]